MGCGMGGACRTAYGHEYARLIVLPAGDAGAGEAGHQPLGQRHRRAGRLQRLLPGLRRPRRHDELLEGRREEGASTRSSSASTGLLLADSILNPPVRWTGEGFCGQKLEQQFAEVRIPDARLSRGAHALPLRSGVARHDDRGEQAGEDVPEPQAGDRGGPGLLVAHRDQVRRRDPAGVHQLRAERHRRVGRGRADTSSGAPPAPTTE